MGYITFNGISEDAYSLTIKNITRSVLPPINNRFVPINSNDGSFFFGANLGNRIIQIEFQLCSTDKQDLMVQISPISSWLFPVDRQPKELIISDDPDYKYYAQVDGSTDINELFSHSTFVVTFVCTDPYKYKVTSESVPVSFYVRNTDALDGSLEDVMPGFPRYGYGGLMSESFCRNEINNSIFANTTANVPQLWNIKSGGDTGSIITENGVVSLTSPTTWATTTSYYGIVETSGLQHLANDSTARWSVGVWFKTTGNAKFRIRVDALNSSYVALTSKFSPTQASTNWTYYKFEYQNITSQFVLGIGFELYADGGTGNSGTVQFKLPNFEQYDYYGTIGAPMVHESLKNELAPTAPYTNKTNGDADILVIPNDGYLDTSSHTFGIGLTTKNFFKYNDTQSLVLNRNYLTLYQDASNYLYIWMDSTTQDYYFRYVLAGTAYEDNLAINFDRLQEVKLYLMRDSSGMKLKGYWNSTTYDSGYTSLPVADFNPTIMYVGSDESLVLQPNAVLYDLFFDSTPDATAYFTGTPAPDYKFLNGNKISANVASFDAPQSPKITLTFTADVTNIKVIEEVSGGYISVLHNFLSGDVLIIDTNARTITKNGSSIITSLDFVNSRWFTLSPDGYSLLIDTLNATSLTEIVERKL
jgi:predicted phage tail component-like protein